MESAKTAVRSAPSQGRIAKPSSGKRPKQLSEIEKLERDNQQLEQRLNSLRSTLARQKEHAASSSDVVWQSAHATRGSLKSYASDVLAKKSSASQKSRYGGLADEADRRRAKFEQEYRSAISSRERLQGGQAGWQNEQATVAPNNVNSAQQSTNEVQQPMPKMWRVPSPVSDPSGLTVTPCPPPGNPSKPANLSYTGTRRPSDHGRLSGSKRSIKAEPPPRRDPISSLISTGAVVEPRHESLLEGAFDEDASHNSFRAALDEWRSHSGNTIETPQPSSHSGEQNVNIAVSDMASLERTADRNQRHSLDAQASSTKSPRYTGLTLGAALGLKAVNDPPYDGVSSEHTASLLDGTFDESVSHNSFLEALQRWRSAKPHAPQDPSEPEAIHASMDHRPSTSTCTSTEDRVPPRTTAVAAERLLAHLEPNGITYMERLMLEKLRTSDAKATSADVNHEALQTPIPLSHAAGEGAVDVDLDGGDASVVPVTVNRPDPSAEASLISLAEITIEDVTNTVDQGTPFVDNAFFIVEEPRDTRVYV
ncbi:hypothetical protein BC832DRAFT_562450 [Gaertneriomyces semiglobifer]|nr:hypothetical protein BC832DRAFT_562450 [Gaertneriomyces semiglobifer]